jgi:PAS domain S-box-containing protein
MTIRKDNVETNYLSCFREYFQGKEESAMACAYEIGRNANIMGIGILELVTIHYHALDIMLQKAQTKDDILRTTHAAQRLFSESLASYEMTNRGFYESLKKLDLTNKELEKEIAERKKAEIALRESEARLEFAMETSHTGAWDLDLVNHTAIRSPEYDRIFGYNELLPQWTYEMFLDHVFPKDRPFVDTTFRHAIETHGDWNFECRIRRKDGVVRWILAAGRHRPAASGTLSIMAGIVQDITERKEAEIALKESERKYHDLFSNMAEEVHFWKLERDAEGRIKTWRLVDVNPPALKTWGRQNVEDIRGKTTDEIFGPGSTEHFMPVVQKIMTEGIPYSYEDYFPNLDKYFRFTSVPMGDYFITTGADITKIKQSEESLSHYAEELASSNQELEAFSYSVSHDLRAPLRSLSGFSIMLAEDYEGKLDAQGKEYLDRIQSSSQLMNQLIDDMLRLSRIGRAEINLEKMDLSELVRAIAEELRSTQPNRNVEFVIQPNVTAMGDKALLRILTQNLLGNAWKYTAKAKNAKIEFSINKLEGKMVYSIKDNGAGFDMTYKDKLFKPFQRLHSNSDYPGTGIGLAIVQRIISRHGGKTWAEGKVGEGATFYFTLS